MSSTTPPGTPPSVSLNNEIKTIPSISDEEQRQLAETRRQEQIQIMSGIQAENLRNKLTQYYLIHCPNNLDNIEALVARVVGGPPSQIGDTMVGGILWSEEELLTKIAAKYGSPV